MKLLLLLAVGSTLLSPFITRESREARKGLEAYQEEAWTEAITRFEAAKAETRRNNAVYDFNLGTASYRSGDFQSAAQRFAVSASSEQVPHENAAYNLGNALYQGGDPGGALKAFRQALRRNPDDDLARQNYELALNQLQQDQDQQQDQNQDQDQDQQQDQQQDQDPNQNQDQQQNPGDDQQQQSQPQQDTQEQQQPENSSQQPSPADRQAQALDKKEAERLLNAVTPEEKELLKARLKAGKRRRTEKDW